MRIVADLCLIPIGGAVSLAPYIAACQRVLRGAGLKTHLHAYGTNIEGEWEAVMAAVKQCHEEVLRMGAPRISTTLKIGLRTDKEQGMEEKVRRVEELLDGEAAQG
jgi:uncharacterized protein (TIGR00106 family)